MERGGASRKEEDWKRSRWGLRWASEGLSRGWEGSICVGEGERSVLKEGSPLPEPIYLAPTIAPSPQFHTEPGGVSFQPELPQVPRSQDTPAHASFFLLAVLMPCHKEAIWPLPL